MEDVVGAQDQQDVGGEVPYEGAVAVDGVSVALVPATLIVALVGEEHLKAAHGPVEIPWASSS